MHGIPHISHPRSIGAPQPGHSISIPPRKNKNALSPSRDKALGKTLCGTTLGCRGLADTTAHSPPSRADGITPVTRPYLLASSFSRRLQGDFRPPRPSALHQTAALFAGTKGVLVLIYAKNVQLLVYHTTFSPIVNGKVREFLPLCPFFRGGEESAALRRGNAPPFSLGLAQRKRPRPVKRKALSRKVGAAGAFLRKTRGRRGRCCADLQTSTGCAIPLGNRDGAPPHLIVRHFFRRWSSNRPASLSAAASPSPGWEIQAPHVYAESADAISSGRRLRGGAAAPPLCVVSRGSGGKSKSPRVSLWGAWGTLLFSKEKCPPSPRSPGQGDKKGQPFG